jgi:ABC-type transport system substrate-binding protein
MHPGIRLPHDDRGDVMSEAEGFRELPRTPLTRRSMLKGAAAAPLAAPLSGFAEPSRVGAAVARQEGNGTTLIVGLDGSPSDLDPHSQYDYRSTIVVRSLYEGLVGLVGSATDELEGLVAESWEANFAFNPINLGTFDFWRMSRTP